MKYIIVFLILSSSLFSHLLEDNEGNSITINHKDSDLKYDNQLVVFEYVDSKRKRIPPDSYINDVPDISDTNNISDKEPNNNGHYVLGINKGIDKYTVTGLQPNREFIIHFIRQDNSPDEYAGLLRGSTNAIEPIEPPTGLEVVNMTNDKIELDWMQPESADGSILIVSKDRLPQLPRDGTDYVANSKYGTNYTVIDGITYTVFNGHKSDVPVLIENIEEDGVYYFQVLSYNGDMYNFNYNTKATPSNTFVYKKGTIQE